MNAAAEKCYRFPDVFIPPARGPAGEKILFMCYVWASDVLPCGEHVFETRSELEAFAAQESVLECEIYWFY